MADEYHDLATLYEPWDARVLAFRVLSTHLQAVEDEDAGAPDVAYEILLGIDDDESAIAIIGRLVALSHGNQLRLTCMAPLDVQSGLKQDLTTEDGRWDALVHYAGLVIDPMWDYCRLAANSIAAGSFGGFEIPEEMPNPSLIKPVHRAD